MMTLIRTIAPELLTTMVMLIGLAAAASAQSLAAPDDVGAAPSDAETTSSGLAHKLIEAGNGSENPSATSNVTVHYTGWLTNGSMFDSSVQRGQTATFPLSGVIRGWTEGLQLMVVGEKRRFWIPADLGYGSRALPGIPPNSMLVFDVELLGIQ